MYPYNLPTLYWCLLFLCIYNHICLYLYCLGWCNLTDLYMDWRIVRSGGAGQSNRFFVDKFSFFEPLQVHLYTLLHGKLSLILSFGSPFHWKPYHTQREIGEKRVSSSWSNISCSVSPLPLLNWWKKRRGTQRSLVSLHDPTFLTSPPSKELFHLWWTCLTSWWLTNLCLIHNFH